MLIFLFLGEPKYHRKGTTLEPDHQRLNYDHRATEGG